MTDLWPDDIMDVAGLRPPSSILKEQAEILAKKTKSILVGRVRQEQVEFSELLLYEFSIHAPVLRYTYDLFCVYHNIELYPLYLVVEDSEIKAKHALKESEFKGSRDAGTAYSIDDEETLLIVLRDLFSTTRTKKIIKSLLAQSADLDKQMQTGLRAGKDDESSF